MGSSNGCIEIWWPDLKIPPINLWSAPYLGRKFFEYEQRDQVVSHKPLIRETVIKGYEQILKQR